MSIEEEVGREAGKNRNAVAQVILEISLHERLENE